MLKYTEKQSALGWDYIERDNGDGTISTIPLDPANSDYQAYLNKDNPDWGKGTIS